MFLAGEKRTGPDGGAEGELKEPGEEEEEEDMFAIGDEDDEEDGSPAVRTLGRVLPISATPVTVYRCAPHGVPVR